MATTPAADNLDEKLRDLLHGRRFQDETKPGYDEVIEMNIKSIKQAFKDAGYLQQCLPKVTDGTLYPMIWAKANGYMTGQEWYDNFLAELDFDRDYPEPVSLRTQDDLKEYITGIIKLVAKRASGIQD